MVTGFTGYPITVGPFFQKTVGLIFHATYSSVTIGKYLIIFSGLGEKKWGQGVELVQLVLLVLLVELVHWLT